MHKPERRAKQARTIRAELVGATGCHCAVAGLYACANRPVSEMCRLLVDAGFDPVSKLICFRGGMLLLTVHNIGDGAPLMVTSKGPDDPVASVGTTAPTRKSRAAAVSAARHKRRANRPFQSRDRRAGKKRKIA
ncbi:hypothetical protein [Bradyrhizobium erythrophlei]|uniref:Uncharacterized protein n=1 Tax=Bradyrhizobium erythrophlei TaxID=1437360 RepID=A0A1M5YIR3_9BRAD|nr:hypothetical protein [Bradyrhizobium erythrophlei]SHI11900.1 hypothetical protein SAMN05443248_8373 [Bradyrhizobium erythrophlei]